MGWQKLRLDQCCDIVSGATPSTSVSKFWDGEIWWATPKDLGELKDSVISKTARKISKEGLASCAAAVLPAGCVLFSSRAPIGHVAINAVPMATNQGFKSMIPDKEIMEARYLYHWLRCHRPYLEGLGNGATFKEISKAVISRVEIPVPPLAEQRRIAAILDQADALRAKRREALARLDEMAQAVFVEMFGDPLTNPKNWPIVRVGDIANVVTGNTPSRLKSEYYGTDIEWIKSDNINTGSYYATIASERLSMAGREVSRMAPPNSILVTCIAGSPGSIGNAAMIDRLVSFNQQINAVVPTSGNPHFLYAQIRVGKSLIQEASTGGMKGLVSKSRFEEIRFMFPPLELQEKFSRKIVMISRECDRLDSAITKTDFLFSSLQHRAFRGEL